MNKRWLSRAVDAFVDKAIPVSVCVVVVAVAVRIVLWLFVGWPS